MSVSLETLVPQEEPVVVEETEEPPVPQEEAPPAPQEEEPPEEAPQVIAPAPKKRGRPRKDVSAPKKAVKIKPPPPPVTPESSDGEPIDRDDMETLLLDYLIKRKQTQQDARRNMWATLAGLS